MKTKLSELTNLTINTGVVLNELLTSTILALDDVFAEKEVRGVITSGIRTAQKQLSIIISKCKTHRIDETYPSILAATVENKEAWLNAWGKLLVIGEMVNPPLPAKAPFDYKRNGELRKAGTLIDISNHMKAHSFDVSGDRLEEIYDTIKYAQTKIPAIKGFLFEPVNHAVHIDCQEIKLDKF